MNTQVWYEQGNYEAVIDALEQNPDDNQLPILAFSYQKLKQWEKAMSCWNKLIAMDASNAEYYNERGVCKFNMRFKHAIQDFDQAILLV